MIYDLSKLLDMYALVSRVYWVGSLMYDYCEHV